MLRYYTKTGRTGEDGIAYLTILFLLAFLSATGLAFLHKAHTEITITNTRGESMQAHYLAEAAANHAMWRLLNEAPPEGDIRLAHNDDDAWEDEGVMKLDNTVLELGNNEYIGVRFLNVNIPQGAVITNAYVEFKASDSDDEHTDITILGEASDDASRFTSADNDITDRSRTAASVTWHDIPDWTKDEQYLTPDLTSIIQEIVSRAGWSSGNAMAILLKSTDVNGQRRSYAHDGSPASAPVLHIEYEGAGIMSRHFYYMHSLDGGRYGYKVRRHTDTTFAAIATVGAVGDHVVHQSYVLYVKPQPTLTSCHAEYVELYQPWPATNSGSWQVVDLSAGPFNVPADAVVEVAVTNTNASAERWGGVRAVGSTLERRFDLHEAEGGGVDAVVMHVQADGSSQIETYAENLVDIQFTLLGYWTCANYVETFVSFSPIAGWSWENHSLGTYGVGAGQVAELVITNTSGSKETSGGLRTDGSGLIRTLNISEAESGGADAATMFVQAGSDAGATIECWADNKNDIDFYLVGYWSTPPGTYTELNDTLGSPMMDNFWQDKDLSGFGVPANAVVQIALGNRDSDEENQMGIREKGSPLQRTMDLQEAEGGGGDIASLHANADENSTIQWYHEDVSDVHEYRLLGYWECTDTFGKDLVGHWKLDEDSGAIASDSSSSGNDGTLTNMDPATDWVSGKIDGALDFDGGNDHVLVPHDSSFSLINQLTVTAWIYAHSGGLDSYDLVLNKGTSGNNRNYWFGTVGDEITFGFYNGGSREFNTSGENLQTETWYHIAATFNNANNRVRVYLDGSEVGSWSTTHQTLTNSDDLYIGRSQYGEYWDGRLDDVRIYNRVLSEAEIAALHALGN